MTDSHWLSGQSGTLSAIAASPGTISIEGNGQTLSIGGTQTLDNVSILIGDPALAYETDALFADGPGGQTATLTLGAHAAVLQTGLLAELAGAGDHGLVINLGSIAGNIAGGTFSLLSVDNAGQASFGGGDTALLAGVANSGTISETGGLVSTQAGLLNTGLIEVSGPGAAYQADPYEVPGLINEGVFRVSSGATASLGLYGYGWTNAGTFAVADALLSVGGSFTAAQLGHVNISGVGTLGLAGTLVNAGTFAIGAGTALPRLALQAGGGIAGGIVADGGSGLLAQGGTLSGVTYRGALGLTQAGAMLTVDDGISLTGPGGSGSGSVAVTGTGAALLFGTSETLDHASVALGGALMVSPGQTLTLGAGAVIHQTGDTASIGSSAAAICNNGLIMADQAGGALLLAGQFANAGTLAINGETLTLQGATLSGAGQTSVTNGMVDVVQGTAASLSSVRLTNSEVSVTGTLQASGATLSVGQGGALPLLKLAGTLAGGAIHDGGSGVAFVGTSVLDGVTYQGAVTIDRPFAAVHVRDGLHLTDVTGTQPGRLALTGAGASLIWESAQALDNATMVIGNVTAIYNAPALLAGNGSMTPVQFGQHLIIQQAGTYAAIGNTTGIFSSAATLSADVAGGNLTLGGNRFTNTGTIGINHGDTVTLASDGFSNAGLLVVGVGSGLDVDLVDYFARGSLADQSVSNTGVIQMAGGILAELTDRGAFPNVPVLNAAAGRIVGAGVVASQIDNQGLIEARGGVLNLVQTVSGHGNMRVDGGATLVLAGVGAGQTISFGGPGAVLGLQPAYFLGALSGFAAGDTIDLFNTQAVSASFTDNTLAVTLADGGTLHLGLAGTLTGLLSVSTGPHGDSYIRYSVSNPSALRDATVAGVGFGHIGGMPALSDHRL